ncbi:hypothetical protein [Pseudomonas savastanoi]|uniref:hypothetical protein n=1 Tax=Pseudomonas savastanoi TaxID=29438 RepID=UPI000EFECD02|nr:hypothetical protein [Pseudomonas savastanoi]RMQ58848.1 hypothetical protein ALQ02_03833 [Pseudomonas savastanoi pv. phaseolicola]
MAVQPGPTEKRYAANGVATSYSIPFLLLEASDLQVTLNGTVITAGFTLTGVGNPASTITFIPPVFATPPSGDLLQRLTDYQENGDFLAITVNKDFDRLWQAIKQLLRFTGRALTLGAFDIDGAGYYRAKGNGIADLRDPVNPQDAVTKNWVGLFIDSVSGAINNTLGIVYDAGTLFDYLRFGVVRSVDNYAALLALSPTRNIRAKTLGYYAAGDGGGGDYIYETGTGWRLLHSGKVNILQFGAKSGFEFDSYPAINAAIQAVKNFGLSGRGGVIEAPNGIFTISGTLLLDAQCCTLKGQGGHATFFRSTALNKPIVKISAPYCFVVGCELATSSEGVSGSIGIEVNDHNFTATDFVIGGVFDGVVIRSGAMHKFQRLDISDCRNTGFLFAGNAPTLFLNDIFISDWFIGSNDNTKFALGHFRVLGRLEALMIGKGDGIGGVYSFTCDDLGTGGMRYCTFNSVFFDGTTRGAVFTNAEHLHFTDCWASNGRGVAAPGMSFLGCSHFTIKGYQGYNCGGAGLFITFCTDFTVDSIDVTANSVDGAEGSPGVLISNSTRFTVANGTGGKGVVGFQTFGLLVGINCSNYALIANNFFDNASGSIFEDAGNVFRRAAFNANYITRAKNVTALPAGQTFVDVPHTLSRVPKIQEISITPNTDMATPAYVSAVNGTTFRVSTRTSNSGTSYFSWDADISEQA